MAFPCSLASSEYGDLGVFGFLTWWLRAPSVCSSKQGGNGSIVRPWPRLWSQSYSAVLYWLKKSQGLQIQEGENLTPFPDEVGAKSYGKRAHGMRNTDVPSLENKICQDLGNKVGKSVIASSFQAVPYSGKNEYTTATYTNTEEP